MQIAGIQKLTLVDFPGKVAATIFTRGCSFRCPFCHNPELVLPDQFNPLFDNKEFFDFLEKRQGKITGICITGGEPCLQPDLPQFISYVKALGFAVKLDTNGSFPDRLAKIIKGGSVDYIAMDIKASLEKYIETAKPEHKFQGATSIQDSKSKYQNETNKVANKLIVDVEKSIKMIMNSGIDYEFRTTVCHPLHEVADFEGIGEMITGAKRYFIQNFVRSKHVAATMKFTPFTDQELADAKRIMKKYVTQSEVR